MKIRYVTLLAAIAGLMAACGNDRKVEPDPSLKEAASGKFLMGGSVECTSGKQVRILAPRKW